MIYLPFSSGPAYSVASDHGCIPPCPPTPYGTAWLPALPYGSPRRPPTGGRPPDRGIRSGDPAGQTRRRGHRATPLAATVRRITAATAAARVSTGRTRLRRFPRPVYRIMCPLLSLPLGQAAAASTRLRGPVPRCRPASSSVGHPSQKPFQQLPVAQVHIGRKLSRLRRVGAAGPSIPAIISWPSGSVGGVNSSVRPTM